MRRCKDWLGEIFGTVRGGRYSIFLDASSRDGVRDPSGVLVVGFRLRWIGSNRLLYRVFRKICVVSTPIWYGFPGYRVKLWMVDYRIEDYLGIYEWAGEKNAIVYAEWLSRLLHHLSASESVRYELRPNEKIENYLEEHREAHAPPACATRSSAPHSGISRREVPSRLLSQEDNFQT